MKYSVVPRVRELLTETTHPDAWIAVCLSCLPTGEPDKKKHSAAPQMSRRVSGARSWREEA